MRPWRIWLLVLALGVTRALGAEPVDPGLIMGALRESMLRGPAAELVRVTVKQPGKPARSDELFVKVDPGKRADRADASVWMELGDLRIHAGGGRLTAVHAQDESSFYAVEYGERLTAATLRKLLPPIPSTLVGLMLPDENVADAKVTLGLTPYTPRVAWKSAEAMVAGAMQVVTVTGVRDPFPGERATEDDRKVTLTIDANESRATKFAAVLPDGAEMRMEIMPKVPGSPATWAIRTGARTAVASIKDLKARRGDVAAAGVVPELTLLDGSWTNWDYRAAFRPAAGPAPTHLALVFVRENSKDAFGAPSADAKAAEDELRRLAAELNGLKDGTVRLVHQTVPVMLTMDDTSRRKVENAVKLREAGGGGGGGVGVGTGLIWATSPETTIERFAPGAAALMVVIRADQTLAGIVLLDGRSREGKTVREDLRRALGLVQEPAAERGEPGR